MLDTTVRRQTQMTHDSIADHREIPIITSNTNINTIYIFKESCGIVDCHL